jgi:hypothetical protein
MPRAVQSPVAGVVALSTNVETVVATLSGLALPMDSNQVVLSGTTMVTSGSTTTAVVVRIRQNGLTGTVVGNQTGQSVVTAAADTNVYSIVAVDNPTSSAGAIYVLTVQDAGGGSGGTTVYSVLTALVEP